MTRALVAAALAALLPVLASCGEEDLGSAGAADRNVCKADAEATDVPASFPEDFPFPDGTVVYHVEDRQDTGVIATGITDLPFEKVLDALNGPAQDAGFEVTEGETEEHDAEANWQGQGYRGRWAIRESGSCEGETVVQVLATPSR